jgi:hypothetical protein
MRMFALLVAFAVAAPRSSESGGGQQHPTVNMIPRAQSGLRARNQCMIEAWSRVGPAVTGHGTSSGYALVRGAAPGAAPMQVPDEVMERMMARLAREPGGGIFVGNCNAGYTGGSGTSLLQRYTRDLAVGTRSFGATGNVYPLANGQFMVGADELGRTGQMVEATVGTGRTVTQRTLTMAEFNRVAGRELMVPFDAARIPANSANAAARTGIRLFRLGRVAGRTVLTSAQIIMPVIDLLIEAGSMRSRTVGLPIEGLTLYLDEAPQLDLRHWAWTLIPGGGPSNDVEFYDESWEAALARARHRRETVRRIRSGELPLDESSMRLRPLPRPDRFDLLRTFTLPAREPPVLVAPQTVQDYIANREAHLRRTIPTPTVGWRTRPTPSFDFRRVLTAEELQMPVVCSACHQSGRRD